MQRRPSRIFFPEAHQPKAPERENQRAHSTEEAHHHTVWYGGIKVATGSAPREGQGQRNEQDGKPARCPSPANHAWPAIFPVGIHAYFRQRFGDIYGEFVRRRVLAGVEAFRAVVAEVRQVIQIGLGKNQPPFHGRKYGAEAFAIAARVTNRHETISFAQ